MCFSRQITRTRKVETILLSCKRFAETNWLTRLHCLTRAHNLIIFILCRRILHCYGRNYSHNFLRRWWRSAFPFSGLQIASGCFTLFVYYLDSRRRLLSIYCRQNGLLLLFMILLLLESDFAGRWSSATYKWQISGLFAFADSPTISWLDRFPWESQRISTARQIGWRNGRSKSLNFI